MRACARLGGTREARACALCKKERKGHKRGTAGGQRDALLGQEDGVLGMARLGGSLEPKVKGSFHPKMHFPRLKF